MPTNNVVHESLEDFEENDDFDPSDYGFVITANGDLKLVMVPEGLMEEPPEEVTAILKLFGIDSIHDVDNPTLH